MCSLETSTAMIHRKKKIFGGIVELKNYFQDTNNYAKILITTRRVYTAHATGR
jgi:hypothetical protein